MGSKHIIISILRRNKKVRYILAGSISYAIEIACLLVLAKDYYFDAAVSVGIAFWVGLFISFLMQKYLAFSNNSTAKKTAWQLYLYLWLVGFNYLFTISWVIFTELFLGLALARTVALVITTFWNYFLYERLIFRTTGAGLSKSLSGN